MSINTIVLSGAGYKGYIHLGVLNVLLGEYNVEDIKVFAGTSIGSLICFLICLGLEPIKIMDILINDDRLHSKSISFFDITEKFGIIDMVCLEDKIAEFVEKEKLYYTFEELLEKTGKHLICVAGNLDKLTVEYFSVETTPNLRCIDAVLASCCIPGIFQARRIKGDLCVDGGPVDHFPYAFACDYAKRNIRNNNQENSFPNINFGVVISPTVEEGVCNIVDFFYRLVSFPTHIKNAAYKNIDNVLYIEDEAKTNKNDLFCLGMRACEKYILGM